MANIVYDSRYFCIYDDYTMGINDGAGYVDTLEKQKVYQLYLELQKLFENNNLVDLLKEVIDWGDKHYFAEEDYLLSDSFDKLTEKIKNKLSKIGKVNNENYKQA